MISLPVVDLANTPLARSPMSHKPAFLILLLLIVNAPILESRNLRKFEDSYADVQGSAEFVGRLNLPGFAGCNVAYAKYPNGRKGIEIPSHCIAVNGRVGDLSILELEFGFQLGDKDNQRLKVTGVECATFSAHTIEDAYKDVCILDVDKFPSGIEPIERVYLSKSAQNTMIADEEKVGFFGFHVARSNRGALPDPQNEKISYQANITRTIQFCNLKKSPLVEYDTARYLFYDCDSLHASSGGAIVRWNKNKNKWQMIGLHKGGFSKDETMPNFAMNAYIHELNLRFP